MATVSISWLLMAGEVVVIEFDAVVVLLRMEYFTANLRFTTRPSIKVWTALTSTAIGYVIHH